MARILDLDMDFFLSSTCELASERCRPSCREAMPWSADDVRMFLEEKCLLSTARPVPGQIFITHDGTLKLWQQLIASGKLSEPFHVTHIDAHSDLGIGYPGPAYVLENVTTRPCHDRADLSRYYHEHKLDEANYLLFALAFRWISDLDNVRNPMSRPDMPGQIVFERNEEGTPVSLRLTSNLSRLMPRFDFPEPVIPYHVLQGSSFQADAPYDVASLAISPRYAPQEADFIADIFRDYIVPIPFP